VFPQYQVRKGRKPASTAASQCSTAKTDQPGMNNGANISGIQNSHVEVINISNCPFNAEVTGNNQILEEEEQLVEP
jgi:hypothetical protein